MYNDEQFVKEFDKYTLAKTYFDLKEFGRAAACVEECTSQKAYFMNVYARYWAGEKRKDDITVDFLGMNCFYKRYMISVTVDREAGRGEGCRVAFFGNMTITQG